jgi:hypothetical protein
MLGLLWTFKSNKSNSHAMRVAEGVSARFQCDFLWPATLPGYSIKPQRRALFTRAQAKGLRVSRPAGLLFVVRHAICD